MPAEKAVLPRPIAVLTTEALAAELRASPSRREGPQSDEARQSLLLRNQVAVLLWQRLGAVRSAARYVFRHQAELVREVTSSYDRRKRAASRRRKQSPAATPPTPVAAS